MEKSIENMWKEAFLKSDALVAPKVNNLFNKKSQHIVDKFKRMFRINLNAMFVFAFIVLITSYFTGIIYLGIAMFPLFMTVIMVNRKLFKSIAHVDYSLDSYQYLKSFDSWLKEQIAVNTKMSRFAYPYVLLALMVGFWFVEQEGKFLGQVFLSDLIADNPDLYLVFGLPLIGIIALVFLLIFLGFIGGKLYVFEMNMFYGKVISKLDEIIADMEELRS